MAQYDTAKCVHHNRKLTMAQALILALPSLPCQLPLVHSYRSAPCQVLCTCQMHIHGLDIGNLSRCRCSTPRQSEYGMLASACCSQVCTGHQLLASAAWRSAQHLAQHLRPQTQWHSIPTSPACLACLPTCLAGWPARWPGLPACRASPIKERHNADH